MITSTNFIRRIETSRPTHEYSLFMAELNKKQQIMQTIIIHPTLCHVNLEKQI